MKVTVQDPFIKVLEIMGNQPRPRKESPLEQRNRHLSILEKADESLVEAIKSSPMFLDYLKRKLVPNKGAPHISRKGIIAFSLSDVYPIYVIVNFGDTSGAVDAFGVRVYERNLQMEGGHFNVRDLIYFNEETAKELKLLGDEDTMMKECVNRFGLPD